MSKTNPNTMAEQINHIQEKLEKVPTKKEMQLENQKLLRQTLSEVDQNYVSKERFKVVESIVFGGVVLGLTYLVNNILGLL